MTGRLARPHIPAGWVDHGRSRPVHDPSAPGEVVGEVVEISADEAHAAISASVREAQAWRRLPIGARAAILRESSVTVRAEAAELALLIARETGKPVREARGEVVRAADILLYAAAEATRSQAEVFAGATEQQEVMVVRRPVGAVAVITPWNFPLAIPVWKIAPALVHGNTVAWKPSPYASLTAARLLEILLQHGLPAGVVALLHGGADVGAAISRHPQIDALTFTGSTAVGRTLVAESAARGVAVQAELGGKNTVIVWRDADVSAAVAGVAAGAFSGNGQKCTATSRVIVHPDVRDRFCDELARHLRDLVVGPADDERTDVGPLIDRTAKQRLDAAIDAAVSGGELIAQSPLDPELEGWFVAPTAVFVDDPAGTAWTDELFGPLVVVTATDDLDHALALVADTEFGLAAAVYTQDRALIRRVIADLPVGMLSINEPTTGGYPYVPFGGWRASGYGPREQGEEARAFYTRTKTVHLGA